MRTEDPADVVIAWEAVEELLACIPDRSTKDILRLMAAGLSAGEVAQRLHLAVSEVQALAARGRIRVLTAALSDAAS